MAENTKMEADSDEQDTLDKEEGDNSDKEQMKEDSDDSTETEPVHDPEIHKLELQVQTNPYHYDSHVQLIKLLQQSGDLDRVRQTRENMSKHFPLTEELWLEWVKDEIPLACIPEHRQTIMSLFERGVKDYQSVKLWIEYCEFVLDVMDGNGGIADVRAVFEKAVTAAGLHVTEGSSIWDGYREFETIILDSYEQMLTDDNKESMEEKIELQRDKVQSLYRRQLAVPLLGIQGTMRDFEDWLDEDDVPEAIVHVYEKAEAKLEEILPYEDTLASAAAPKLEAYKRYLEYELRKAEPVRVQCLYERALKDNCLVGDLWIEYTCYLDSKLKMALVVLPAHERAVKNCPWVAVLWQNYLRALERAKQDESKIKETLDKALGCGFSNAGDYLQLWRCYCSFMRRRVQEWNEDSQPVKDLRESFKSGIGYLQNYFGNDGDSTNLLDRYWARIEAFQLNNMTEAQRLWEQIITGHARELDYWLEYANIARSCRDLKLSRKILQRAVQSASDNPEAATQALLSFEEEEGTLEDWNSSFARCHTRINIINEQRAKAAVKEAAQAKGEEDAAEKRQVAKAEKKAAKKVEKKAKAQTLKRRARNETENDVEGERKQGDEATEPAAKKACVEEIVDDTKHKHDSPEKPSVEENPKHDRSADPRKIFISNLLFTITEEELKETFSKLGEVVDVRLVKNVMGRSKGYAYVEFKDESSVEAALALDRDKMKGRPMFVSPCVDKAKNPTTFKFPTSLDKHTLFVSNLPFDVRESEMETLFSQHGKIKQVRLVTNRAGKPKGYGYVEYEQESAASTAVIAMDGSLVGDRTVSVSLSNPPTRKPTRQEQAPPPPPPGSRGRAKTQLQLLPRALQKTSATSSSSSSASSVTSSKASDADKPRDHENSEEQKGFSNEYFRSLMQRK